MKSFGIVYKVTNKINCKVYIGQTIRGLHERRRKHNYSKDATYFHNSINKYGKDNFKWEVLEECDTQEELNIREIYYISKYNSIEKGYNLMGGGGIQSGWNHSEESKNKMSIKIKEWYKNNDHPNLGRKWSKEVRKRMSESKKDFKPSKKQRLEHSCRMTGKGNPMYGKSGHLAPASKKYIVIEPDGKEIVVHGLNSFCRNNGLNSGCMVRCAKKIQKQHKGYKCKYFNGEVN